MKSSGAANLNEPMTRFARATHGSTAQVEEMRKRHIYADGVLPAKTKILMALLWSINARCEPCIGYYARRASEMGASEAEIGETLAVATTMGACVAETWAMKAFGVGGKTSSGGAC
jgi:AhpD family alkylhydroperoxidase